MNGTTTRTLGSGLAIAASVWAAAASQAATAGRTANAQLPVLKPGVRIRVGDQPLNIGHTASPEVLDWNNDGKKDLLVGTFSNGKVVLFLNQGADEAPAFRQGVTLQAGGRDLKVGFG